MQANLDHTGAQQRTRAAENMVFRPGTPMGERSNPKGPGPWESGYIEIYSFTHIRFEAHPRARSMHCLPETEK